MADSFVNKVTFSGKPAMARADEEFYMLLPEELISYYKKSCCYMM